MPLVTDRGFELRPDLQASFIAAISAEGEPPSGLSVHRYEPL